MSIKSLFAAPGVLALAVALASPPAFSQGAMTPRADVAPRAAPAAPAAPSPTVAPVAPPVVPTVPVIPNASGPAPGDPAKLTVRKAGGKDNMEYLKTPDGGGTPTNDPAQPNAHNKPIFESSSQSRCCEMKQLDANGQFTFRQLEPGNHSVQLPNAGPKGGEIIMTTSVNGKLAARTVYPPGSSVGTFAVSSAKDTVTLKFESNGVGAAAAGAAAGTAGMKRPPLNQLK